MQIPFIGGAYLARSAVLDAQRCVNLYLEAAQGNKPAALIGCPGTRLLVTLDGSGGIRGEHTPTSGDSIVVRGNRVYRVSSSWVATLCGTIGTTTGPVSIDDNGEVAVIVDGSVTGYVLTLADNTLSTISDPDFLGADRVAYLDDYFIFNRPDSQQFYISELGSGTSYDALDFASAEGAPDELISLIADHRELWLFGKVSTEVFFNTGNADFPFERAGNAFIECGCAAPFAVTKIDNSVFWLGRDKNGLGIIWRANGYTPTRISTHAIEYAIRRYSSIEDCIGFSYQDEGHSFVVFTFPTGNATWVYDCATGEWHERAYMTPATGALNRHRANCHMFFGGEHVIGDWENGNLYAWDLDVYSDNGDAMPAIRSAPHQEDPNYKRLRFDELELQMETGVGLSSGQGSDPQAMLDWSKDGGRTWSNQHWASIGLIGEYEGRVRWLRLGRSRSRVFRITITDPVKRVIIGASLNAVGSN